IGRLRTARCGSMFRQGGDFNEEWNREHPVMPKETDTLRTGVVGAAGIGETEAHGRHLTGWKQTRWPSAPQGGERMKTEVADGPAQMSRFSSATCRMRRNVPSVSAILRRAASSFRTVNLGVLLATL